MAARDVPVIPRGHAVQGAAPTAPLQAGRFAPDAKKSLELALREAIRLKHKRIDRVHLMLGILRAECPGRALLERAGADAEDLRTALEEQPKAA